MSDWPQIYFRIRSGLSYLSTAQTRYLLHSPFVFDFYQQVLRENSTKAHYLAIEAERKQLLRNQETYPRIRTAANGLTEFFDKQALSSIVKREACPPVVGRFLSRFCAFYQARNVLELGVNTGFSGAYMLYGNPSLSYTGVDGNEKLLEVAKRTLHAAQTTEVSSGARNVQLICSSFDDFLAHLPNETLYDLVYLDGNHRSPDTLQYIQKLSKHIQPGGCIILDDIRWSADMYQDWSVARTMPEVSLSVELFRLGLLWFGQERVKQDFVLASFQGI